MNKRSSKLDGQGMKAVIQEFLERIIHKPVALNSCQAIKLG